MTRETALKVNKLLLKIESYEVLLEDIQHLEALQEIVNGYQEEDLEAELVSIVKSRLDKTLKELEEI
jgi:hypothetical protein